MWVKNRSLVEFHLSEVTFEQGFQLKIRGNTKTQENRWNLQYLCVFIFVKNT